MERWEKAIFWCMCGFALTIPMWRAAADTFTGLALLLGVAACVKERAVPRPPAVDPYIRGLLVFFGVYFVFIFISGDLAVSAKAYWRYFNRMIPFALVLLFVKEPRRLRVIFGCALAALFFDGLYIIGEGARMIASGLLYVRAAGVDRDVIGTAGFLLIDLPLVVVLLQRETGRARRGLYFLLCLVGAAALVMNGTRIAWLTMAVLLPLSLFFCQRNRRKAVLILLAVCAAASVAVYSVPAVQARLCSFVDRSNTSNQGHLSINKSALKMIEDRPLLGWGLGFFPKVFNESYITPETKRIERHISHAHNDTLLVGAETGVVGIAAFWFMFGSFLYYSLRQWRAGGRTEDLLFFMITLAAVLQGFTDTRFGMHQVTKLYFLLMAVYLNYKYCAR